MLGYEYPKLEVGDVYDMGDGVRGKVTAAWRNGTANMLVLDGPTKGITWCVNGQSTSVYTKIEDGCKERR